MRKLTCIMMSLLCVCAMKAQGMESTDTTVVESTASAVVSEPAQSETNEEVEEPKSEKEFHGRRSYFNLGYAWLKTTNKDANYTRESDNAFFIVSGKTYYLHKKAIAQMIKIGLDVTWFDITYSMTSFPGLELLEDNTLEERKIKMHTADYSMHIGPSVTVNPIDHLCVSAYFRYAPTFTASFMDNDGWEFNYGYASMFVTGAAVSYRVISVGIEYRFGTTQMNTFTVDNDIFGDADYGDMENGPDLGLDEVFKTGEKIKYKLSGLRLYLGFRF